MTRSVPCGRDERGIILPMTLIILVVLATLISAMLALGTTEPQIAANLVRGAQALSLAEAGAERALALFAYDANYSKCVESANNLDDYPGYPNDSNIPHACGTTGSGTLWTDDNTGVSSGGGTYTVTWGPTPSAAYATILITSVGTTTTPSVTRTVRVMVTKQWASNFGVLANTMKLSGSSMIEGNAGAVHGNGGVTLDGSDYVLQTATSASVTCDGCYGHTGDSSDSGANKPAVTLPNKTAADYFSKATVYLGGAWAAGVTSAGQACCSTVPTSKCSDTINVVTGSGNSWNRVGTYAALSNSVTLTVPSDWLLDASTTSCTVYGYTGGGHSAATGDLGANYTPLGSTPVTPTPNLVSVWSMGSAGDWTAANGTPTNGAYYAATNISTNSQTSSTAWSASFIVGGTGSSTTSGNSGTISIAGNPTMTAYNNLPMMIAGNIKLNGSGSFTGTVIATSTVGAPAGYQGNIDFGGNVQLVGNTVAYNYAYISGSPAGGGNPSPGKVIYNVSGRTHMLSPKLKILSWHAISTLD